MINMFKAKKQMPRVGDKVLVRLNRGELAKAKIVGTIYSKDYGILMTRIVENFVIKYNDRYYEAGKLDVIRYDWKKK